MTGHRQISLCFLLILSLGTAALAGLQAQEPGAVDPSPGGQVMVQRAPGTAGEECKFRTHNCEACAIDEGKVTCSSVGIACEPTEWRCLDPQPPQK